VKTALLGIFLCVLCILCGDSARADAQILIGVEAEHDRFTYHFDNPSSFDTTALVPHFFEQTYIADNIWLTAAARYTAGIRWETAGGITPNRESTETDYDTFVDPDGSVIVSGTTGPATVHSMRISQRGELARAGAFSLTAGFRVRVDWANWDVGHKTVTRGGVLQLATDVTTPEMTRSVMTAAFVGAGLTHGFDNGWTVAVNGEAAPATLGQLLVQLPEKYTGQDLNFLATVFAARGDVVVARRWDAWMIELAAGGGTTWSYKSTASLDRTTYGARISIGHRF
jgi:hypothetical protein